MSHVGTLYVIYIFLIKIIKRVIFYKFNPYKCISRYITVEKLLSRSDSDGKTCKTCYYDQ